MSREERIPVSEWVTAALGLTLLLVALAFLLRDAARGPRHPPELTVRVLRVTGRLVEFRAYNGGDTTAAAVTIQGTVTRAGDTVDTAGATLDYLPARSHRDGGLLFSLDPTAAPLTLTLRATGYQSP